MPPKGKGKGKGKLSKAEKERLKQEEAERKAQEEEEARLKAEQEEKEREEKEQREREERRVFEEQERARHQAEVDELNLQLQSHREFLDALYRKESEKKKWEKFMKCDGRPDPSSKKDINTFINLTKEDSSNTDMSETLKTCEMILELIDELQGHMSEVQRLNKSEENEENIINNEKLMESYNESKQDLEKLIFQKLDESSFELLKSPNKAIDPDTFNICQIEQSKRLKVCLWGNAAKNPRVKQVEFPDDGFTMDLPKQMALSTIALQTLYINYDFCSPNCSTFAYKPPKKTIVPEIVEINEEEAEAKDNENEENDEDSPKSQSAIGSKSRNELLGNQTESPGTPSTTNLNSASGSRVPVNEENTGLTPSSASKKEESLQNATKSEENEEEDDEDYLEEDVIDLRSFSPIGPLVVVDLIHLPHQAKEIKGWTVQQVSQNGLERIQYGKKEEEPTISNSTHDNKSVSNIHSRKSSSLGYTLPIAFSASVAKNILIHEPPQIARWDEETKHWRTSGITDVRYEEDDKMIFYRTEHFGPFAVMQDIYLNMPFQTWQIRPTGLNECVFNIIGANDEVDIIVKDGLCSVKFPIPIPDVAHVAGKWVRPEQLIQMLRSVGLNLFPYQDGYKYVSICKKVDSLMDQLYQHMALSASCCSYTWSKWNNDIGEEKVVVQACEWNSPKIPTEEAYSLYLASTLICSKLKMIEYTQEFSEEIAPGSQMHPDLYHMLRDGASEENGNILKNTSVVFADCVHQLLVATNVFMYA